MDDAWDFVWAEPGRRSEGRRVRSLTSLQDFLFLSPTCKKRKRKKKKKLPELQRV